MSNVDHPEHYNKVPIEVIDIIEAYELDFNQGNVIKYLLRAPYKANELEDLEKALWYLNRHVDRIRKIYMHHNDRDVK